MFAKEAFYYLYPRIIPRLRHYVASVIGPVSLLRSKPGLLPYAGVVGIDNLGDEAIFQLAQDTFAGRNLRPCRYSNVLDRFVTHHYISSSDNFIVGGGTLLLGSPRLLRLLEDALDGGQSLHLFGTGVSSPDFWGPLPEEERERWVKVLNRCSSLGVRGPLSRDILQELGVEGAHIVGDPAVSYTVSEPQVQRAAKTLGVNWGTTSQSLVWGGDEASPRRAVAGALTRLVANGWKLRFFSVWPRDVHAIKTLAAEAGLTDYDLVTEYASAKRFIAEAQQCRIFLGFKLHATILAVCAGCATVALEYRPKVRDYMTSINAETWNMRLDVMTEHTLVERLERIEKVSNQVSKQQWRASKALADEFKDYSRCLVEKCALHSGGRQR